MASEAMQLLFSDKMKTNCSKRSTPRMRLRRQIVRRRSTSGRSVGGRGSGRRRRSITVVVEAASAQLAGPRDRRWMTSEREVTGHHFERSREAGVRQEGGKERKQVKKQYM